MFDPKTLCREVANRDRVDGRSLPQLQITACAHETVQRVPPFKVPTTEVFCLHGFVDWCRFASTSIHCPSAADMGEVLLARLLLFLLACCLPPCLLPQVPSCAWVSRKRLACSKPSLRKSKPSSRKRKPSLRKRYSSYASVFEWLQAEHARAVLKASVKVLIEVLVKAIACHSRDSSSRQYASR